MTWNHFVGFGEAMVRLTSPVGTPLPAATQLAATVGGAELNALVAARLAGAPAAWVTALPDGPVADLVRRQAVAAGVAVHLASATGRRVGLYFLEHRAAPRPSRVTYDRAGSAFATLDPGSLDWTALLDQRSCLLLSGITPALGGGPRTAMRDAIAAARAVGATIALDVNFRASLWTAEECFGFLADVIPDVDVLSASEQDLRSLGIDDDDPHTAAAAKFGLRAVVGTRKGYDGGTVAIEVVAADGEAVVRHRAGATIVDAVGAGDALFGTFLAALPAEGLDRAAARALAAAVAAYGSTGDLLAAAPDDLAGPGGGVQR